MARFCGADPGLSILPFRGEYYQLTPERRGLVRGLIYPVPDPRFPFLGVHLTLMVNGGVEAGPNAVLALKREGYRWRDVSLRDAAGIAAWPGFWHLAARFWRTGLTELRHATSRAAFARAAARYVPEITADGVEPAFAGVRAQALARDGRLVDDFVFSETDRALHVRNAPSPGATSSLAIARHVADEAARAFDLPRTSPSKESP